MNKIVESFDLADKVIEELTIRHDELFTLRQVHSMLYDKYAEFRDPELRTAFIDKLNIVFLTIEGEYNNIYRVVKDNKNYLIWTLKKKEEVLENCKVNVDTKQIDKDTDTYLDSFLNVPENYAKDYIAIIKKMIDTKNFSFMYETNFLDGVNHPIHLLILNNEVQLIKRLNDLTTIDYTIRNKEGKSCVDLAKEVRSCDLVEFFMERNFDLKFRNLLKNSDTLKESQKAAYEKISTLTKKNTELEEKCKNVEKSKVFNTLKNLIICTLLYFYFNK